MNSKAINTNIDKKSVDAIKEQQITNPQLALVEALKLIWSSFEKSEIWKDLDEYTKTCLVEQAFLLYFASFPTHLTLAVALDELNQDPTFMRLESNEERLAIRKMLKDLAISIKSTGEGAEKTNPVYYVIDKQVKLKMDDFLKTGVDKHILEVLTGQTL